MNATLLLLSFAAPPAVQPVLTPRPEASALFATRVQPILMNLCMHCHSHAEHPSPYKLRRFHPGYADPEAARVNLAATLPYIRADAPDQSRLLEMARTAHGGDRKPPFVNGDHPAYRTLAAWVSIVWPASHRMATAWNPPQPVASSTPTAGAILPASATMPAPTSAPPQNEEPSLSSPNDPFGPAALRQFLAMPR